MAKYIRLPGGNAIEVPDGMSYADAMASAQQRFPELFAPALPPPESGFMPAFKATGRGLLADTRALASRFGAGDVEEAAKYREKVNKENEQRYKQVEFSEDPLNYIKGLAGSSAAYMLAPVAAGAAGAGIAALAPEMAGAALLGTGAAGLTSAAQFTTSNFGRQLDTGKTIQNADVGAAALAAIPQTILDIASLKMLPGLGRMFGAAGMKLSEKELKTLAEQGLKKTLAEYTFKTGQIAGVEGLTEASQQVLERMQAGLSLTDPEARKEYFDNFVGGAVLGGVIAPAGHYMEKGRAMTAAKKAADERIAAENKATQDAEEAEKSKPENLLKLHDDYQSALQQMQQLSTAAKKPKKDASDEEKAAYQQAKDAANTFKNETLKPLGEEYAARKGQLAPLLAERARYAKLETEAAAQQPTEGRIETPVQTLMAQYETLNQQTSTLAGQLQQAANAGDAQTHTTLLEKYKALEAQKQNLAGLIEQQGGAAGFSLDRTPQEFQGLPGQVAELERLNKQIEALGGQVEQTGADGDFEAQNKHLADLAAAKAQQAAIQQDIERRRTEIEDQQARASTGMGETLPLFSSQAAPSSGPEIADAEPVAPIAGIAQTPAQARPLPKLPPRGPKTLDMFKQAAEEDRIAAERAAADAQAEQERANRERGQTLPLFTEEEAPIPPAELEDKAPPEYDYQKSQWPFAEDAEKFAEKPSGQTKEDADAAFEKARLDKFWATAPSRAGEAPKELDLFSDANLIRTSVLNGDHERYINNATRAKEREAQTQNADAKAAARRRLIDGLDKRFNLKGLKLTRTVTPEEFDAGMEKIAQIKRSIENPQGNAKKSLLQKAVDAYAAREKYTAVLESGVMPLLTPEGKPTVFPTWLKGIEKAANKINYGKSVVPGEFTGVKPITLGMKDKVAVLKARLKGETTLTRPLTNEEKYAIKRKIDAAESEYNELIAHIAPASQKIFAIYQGMHETTPLRRASNVAKTKEDAVDALGRSRNKISKEAATATRIAAGDVEQEAASSLELRQLALNEGRKTEAYTQARSEWVIKRDKIIKKFGKESEAYIRLTDAAKAALQAVGIKEGVKSQVYKDALKAATERLKAATAETAASKQTPRTKRTEQVVRKATVEPGTMRTGSTESKEGATTTKVKRGATSAEVNPKRKPFVATDETPDTEPPTQEAKPRSPKAAFRTGVEEAEDIPLNEDAKDGLASNDLQGTLGDIASSTTNDVIKAVAQRLQFLLKETHVNMVDGLTDNEGNFARGACSADGSTIWIDKAHGQNEQTVIHEAVHAATERLIKMDESKLTPDQLAAKKELQALYEEIKSDDNIKNENAKSSLSEFVAEALSDKNLQDYMHSKPWTIKNAWESFKNTVLKLLGVDIPTNMRDATLAAADRLFTKVEAPTAESIKGMAPRYRLTASDALTDMLQGERITSSSAAALVAEEPTLWAKVRAGNLGLRLRQAALDSWASIDAAVTKGVDKKVLSSLEGEQAMYYLRAGENRNAYVNQAITHGPLQLAVQNTPNGKSITFNSVKGATLMRVAELAGQAKLGNEATTEAYFTAYIAGQRAEKLGWEKLNTDPKIAKDAYAEVMDLLKANPKAKEAFEAAAKEYKAYNNGLIDFTVQCGALSKKVGDRLKETPYVPFYRVDNGNVILDLGGKSIVRIGNIKQQPNLKDLVGSNRKIMPIYTSAIQNTAMLTEMALRNIRTKNTCFTLLKMGAIKRIGEGDGPEGAVRFFDNGVKKYAIVDTDTYGIPADMFVKSMEGIATSMPFLIRMMGMPTNLLRLAVTRMPAYAIRQAIRDPMIAWMTTGMDGVPVLNSMKELTKMVAGRSPEEERLMAAGAITSNVYTGDQRDMARFLRDMQSGKSGWEKLMSKADAFALKGDAATRVTIYKDSIAKGMTELQALMRAQESMNFSRHGLSASARLLSTLIPFFNAQLQGLDVLYRAMRGKMDNNERLEIQKKLFARGAMVTATTMAYIALMQDDDAYKQAKPEERYNNFFVRIPGLDEPVRVPIMFELGYLFKAIPEALVDVWAHDESASKAVGGIGKLLWQSNPFSLPQGIKPATEVVLGKSFFGGDIESPREQGLKATERFRPGTTELAKLIGSVTGEVGLSPIKIDYLVRGYTGSAGIAAMSLLNPLLKQPAPGGKEVQEPTKPLSKNVLIGGLFQPNDGRGILDEAFAQMKDVQQAQNTYKKKIDDGDLAGAREFATKYADELALASVSGAAYKQLGVWAKQERQITASPKLTTEQKDVLIKRLRNAENAYAERLLKVSNQGDRTTRQ